MQDPVLACRVSVHDAALSYDAARAGENQGLHWCYSVTDYSMEGLWSWVISVIADHLENETNQGLCYMLSALEKLKNVLSSSLYFIHLEPFPNQANSCFPDPAFCLVWYI